MLSLPGFIPARSILGPVTTILRGSRLVTAGLIAACTAIGVSLAAAPAASASTAARASTSAHASTSADAKTTAGASTPAQSGASLAQLAMLEQRANWAAQAKASRTSVITGSVVGIDGQPVSGACVTAVGPAGSATVAAAANGTFRLAGLGAGGYALEYRDCAASGSFLPGWSGGAASQGAAARYQVAVGQVRQVPVMTLKPANPAAVMAADQASFERTIAANSRSVSAAAAAKTGQISGTVTGKGKPLSGICIDVVPVYAGRVYGAKSGKNGVYTVRHVAPGSYHVIFAPFFECPSHANWLQQVYKNNNDLNAVFSDSGAAVRVRAGHTTSGIDGNLRLGGEISGTVTSKSGATQHGICVFADGKVARNQYEYSSAKTSGDGAYQLHALFPGKYTVGFSIGCGSHGNYAPVNHKPVKVALAQRVTVNQVLPTGASISGKVTLTSSSGTPIEGICVYAFETDGVVYGTTATDANGHYRVIGLVGGRYSLYFRPGCKNYGNYVATTVNTVTTAGEPDTGVNAVLQVGGTISGTVTDTHGNPVADECIELDGTGNYTALVPYRTGSDGTYVIDQLSAGTYQVGFFSGCGNSASYAPTWYGNQPSEDTATPIAIATGATFTANVVMQPGATITGRVTNAAGHRLSNICVDATAGPFSGEFYPPLGALTRTHNGNYTLSGLAPGNYLINFGCGYGARFPALYFPDAPDAGLAQAVSAGPGTTSGIDAVLPYTGIMTGKVTNSAGHPLADVCIVATNTKGAVPALRGPGLLDTGTTGVFGFTTPKGTYKLMGLAAGRYVVSFNDCFFRERYAAQWYPDKSSIGSAAVVTIRSGKTTPGISGRLAPGGTISGHVTNASGKSLGSICVTAADSAGDTGGAITGNSGAYSIPALGAGAYTVDFAPCGGRNLVTVVSHGSVRASRVTTVNAAMHAGGTIAGVVTAGSSSGPPVSDACVEAYSTGSTEPASFGLTGFDGSYQVTGLPTGTYQVYFGDPQCDVSTPDLAPQWFSNQATQAASTPVSVTVRVTTGSVDAALQPDGEITGTVSAGSPATALSGACVTAFPVAASGSLPVVAVSGRSGYTLANLLPGQYKVRFAAGCGTTGYATQWYSDAATRAKATVITVTPAGTATGVSATLSKS